MNAPDPLPPPTAADRRRWRVALAVLCAALALATALGLRPGTPPLAALRLVVRSGVAANVQVFFDLGSGTSELLSVRRPVAAGRVETLLFPLPARPVRAVRVDPLDVPGSLTVRAISVVREADGQELAAFEPEALEPTVGIARTFSDQEGLELTTAPAARDPQAWLQLPAPLGEPPPLTARIARAVCWDAVLCGVFCAVAAVTGLRPGRAAHPAARRARAREWARRWFPDLAAFGVWMFPLAVLGACLVYITRTSYYLEMRVASDRPADFRVYYDDGTGTREEHSAGSAVAGGDRFQTLRLPVGVGALRALRLDPAQTAVSMRVSAVALRSPTREWSKGRPLLTFDLHAFQPLRQVASLTHEGDTMRIVAAEGADDPAVVTDLPAPLRLGVDWRYVLVQLLLASLGWLALWVLVAEMVRRLPPGMRTAWRARWDAAFRRAQRLPPVGAIWLVAFIGTVLGTYPVIFLGKSFVSPGSTSAPHALRSTATPRLPPPTQADALFHDGELPLWNRYDHAGLPLLGQGRSMFGDPLHVLVIATRGAAWAWDLKFLLARWVFAAGAGLLVWSAVANLPAAGLVTFAATLLGFFSARPGDPAVFSVCYAPWILYAWLRIVRAADWRASLAWAGALIVANWCELTSGTVTEAGALGLCLNGCGALALVIHRRPAQDTARRVAALIVAGVVFCLLAAPLWLSFSDTLEKSALLSDTARAWQFPPGVFLGLFDDIFYRPLGAREGYVAPAANFLVLFGCLWAVGAGRRLRGDRFFVAVAVSALLPVMLAFGVMPSWMIRAVPLLSSVTHLDDAFSCVLLIYGLVLAGYGFKHCLARAGRLDWGQDALTAFILGGVLLALYFGSTHTYQPEADSVPPLEQGMTQSAFFFSYASLLLFALLLLPFIVRRLALRGPQPGTVILLLGCLALLPWRAVTRLSWPDRAMINPRSPALDFLRVDRSEPFRTVEPSGTLRSTNLESIQGPGAFLNPHFQRLTHFFQRDRDASAAAGRERSQNERLLLDLLNVRYILTSPDTPPPDPDLTRLHASDLDIYRNEHAWPRAFFVDRLDHCPDVAAFAAELRTGKSEPFAAIDDEELRLHPELAAYVAADESPTRKWVAASHYRLTTNRTLFDLDAPGPGFLVLAEGYLQDDIVAALNKRPTPVFRVNQAFRGVRIEHAGHYRVSFVYRPRWLTGALIASALGVVLFVAAAAWLYLGAPVRRTAPTAAVDFRPSTRP